MNKCIQSFYFNVSGYGIGFVNVCNGFVNKMFYCISGLRQHGW